MRAQVKFDFSGSVVLVTGGGAGIGRSIALAFDAAGATVVVTGRGTDSLDSVVAEADSSRMFAHQADVSSSSSVQGLIDGVLRDHGQIDVVVSNAGKYIGGSVHDVTDDDWQTMLSTNVNGLFNLARACYEPLVQAQGNLVAVSSVSGLAGDWGQAPYNATKGAVSQLVKSLALDWGEAGVRVNAIAPSLTDTGATHGLVVDELLAPQFEARTALGRLGTPDDMAGPVMFLASPAAAYVTGTILPVDGGTMASSGQAHVA